MYFVLYNICALATICDSSSSAQELLLMEYIHTYIHTHILCLGFFFSHLLYLTTILYSKSNFSASYLLFIYYLFIYFYFLFFATELCCGIFKQFISEYATLVSSLCIYVHIYIYVYIYKLNFDFTSKAIQFCG